MFRVFCLFACLALVGCGGGGGETSQDNGAAVPPRQVRVDWLGFESFLFQSSLGTKILTNPYEAAATGRAFPSNIKPDVVLISSEQSDSNNLNAVDNTPVVFRGAVGIGPNNAVGIRIRGVPTYKNPEKEEPADMNVVYIWTLDGVRFCFAGNIENVLAASEMISIGQVDVLLLPIGVPPALTNSARQTIVNQLHPKVIIPMGRAADFTAWASAYKTVHRLQGSSVMFSPETLPAEQTVLIFASP